MRAKHGRKELHSKSVEGCLAKIVNGVWFNFDFPAGQSQIVNLECSVVPHMIHEPLFALLVLSWTLNTGFSPKHGDVSDRRSPRQLTLLFALTC